MWTREELKARGKMAVRRNYWSAVLVAFVIMLISGGFSSGNNARNALDEVNNGGAYYNGYTLDEYYDDFAGGNDAYDSGNSLMESVFGVVFSAVMMIVLIVGALFTVFIGNPLSVGGKRFFILNQTEQASAKNLGYAFTSGNVGNVILTLFLRDLYVTLWTLLFIIPGIVKALEYRMVPYILAENPGMNRTEAFAISKQMMDGQKWDVFVLDLSFLGWELLSGLTLGILGIFWVNPYIYATDAELYTKNREMAYQKGFIR